MSLNRYRARTDRNHREIAAAFRKLGWKVFYSKVPTDLIVLRGGRMLLIEIKSDAWAKLTQQQVALIRDGWPVRVVHDISQVEQIR
jgi:hypothetical protein